MRNKSAHKKDSQTKELKLEIYINHKPISEYSEDELEDIKKELTRKALEAAGYKQEER